MKTKKFSGYAPQQMVYFRWDGSPSSEGEGTFQRYFSHNSIVVRLTAPCKEHPVDTGVIVLDSEVI